MVVDDYPGGALDREDHPEGHVPVRPLERVLGDARHLRRGSDERSQIFAEPPCLFGSHLVYRLCVGVGGLGQLFDEACRRRVERHAVLRLPLPSMKYGGRFSTHAVGPSMLSGILEALPGSAAERPAPHGSI